MGATRREIYAAYRKQFTAADLQKYTEIEPMVPAEQLLAELEARGHSFAKVGRKGEVKYGYAAVAVVNAAKGTVEGGAEPRRSHATRAPNK